MKKLKGEIYMFRKAEREANEIIDEIIERCYNDYRIDDALFWTKIQNQDGIGHTLAFYVVIIECWFFEFKKTMTSNLKSITNRLYR